MLEIGDYYSTNNYILDPLLLELTVFELEKQVETQENLLKEVFKRIEMLEKKLHVDTENYCTDMYCDDMEPFYQSYGHQVR